MRTLGSVVTETRIFVDGELVVEAADPFKGQNETPTNDPNYVQRPW